MLAVLELLLYTFVQHAFCVLHVLCTICRCAFLRFSKHVGDAPPCSTSLQRVCRAVHELLQGVRELL